MTKIKRNLNNSLILSEIAIRAKLRNKGIFQMTRNKKIYQRDSKSHKTIL